MHARVVAGVAIALLLSGAAPAWADGGGDAWTDDNEVGAEATDTGTPRGVSDSGSPVNPCRYSVLDTRMSDIADDMAVEGIGPPRGEEPGAWYRRTCDLGNGNTSGSIIWIADGVDPEQLAAQAEDRAPIPAPSIRMNPDAGDGSVVHVPTWLWIDGSQWVPVSAQASAGGVTVTATAAPQSVTWDMGNGDTVVCQGPGTPYDASRPASDQTTDCSYTYERSSASQPDGTYLVTATVSWNVTWTIVGAPGGGGLGASPRSESVAIPVAEIQALNQ
jgi:hypothetical protein